MRFAQCNGYDRGTVNRLFTRSRPLHCLAKVLTPNDRTKRMANRLITGTGLLVPLVKTLSGGGHVDYLK